MKRFAAGLLLGLLLSGAAGRAEWENTDYQLMKATIKMWTDLAVGFIAVEKKRLEAEEWQARSLQRIVWVLERQYPAPPEKKP